MSTKAEEKDRAFAVERAHEVFGRAKARGSLPDLESDDEQERQDAEWIEDMRKAKQGRNIRPSRERS